MQAVWQGLRWLPATAAAPLPSLLLRPRARLSQQAPESVWDWAHWRAGGEPCCGSGILAAIAAAHAEARPFAVGLIVPGEDALVLDLALPPGNATERAAAGRYLAEDYLLEDVEAVHVALSGSCMPERQRVIVINAQCLAGTLQALASVGLPVTSAWVDHELLAVGRDKPASFVDGQRVLLCAPRVAGFAGSAGVAARWLAVHGASAVTVDIRQAAFFSALRWPQAAHVAVDLLQGPFEPPARIRARRQAVLGVMGRAMALPAALLAFALLLGSWHGHRASATRAEARAVLLTRQPALARAPSLERALEAWSSQHPGPVTAEGPDFRELLGAMAAALADQAADRRPRLLRMQYRQSRLEVHLDAASVEILQGLQSALAARGTPARLVSASRVGERFEGRLRLGHAAT
jgi:type II secretion system protein L